MCSRVAGDQDRHLGYLVVEGALYSDFLNYLEETKELAEEVPELYSDIILDNKNLVIDHQSSMSSSLWLLLRKGIMSTGSSLQV